MVIKCVYMRINQIVIQILHKYFLIRIFFNLLLWVCHFAVKVTLQCHLAVRRCNLPPITSFTNTPDIFLLQVLIQTRTKSHCLALFETCSGVTSRNLEKKKTLLGDENGGEEGREKCKKKQKRLFDQLFSCDHAKV